MEKLLTASCKIRDGFPGIATISIFSCINFGMKIHWWLVNLKCAVCRNLLKSAVVRILIKIVYISRRNFHLPGMYEQLSQCYASQDKYELETRFSMCI